MHGQTNSRARASAIQLRKRMTDAERMLWRRLRYKQLGVRFLRTANLEAAGFRVLRFWNNEVLNQTEAVLERILAELAHPLPSPPLEGEGAARDS